MRSRRSVRSAVRAAEAIGGVAAGMYAASGALSWARYGRVGRARCDADALLDRFMPEYDVIDRHQIRVSAPAAVTLAAAQEIDLAASSTIRAIFKARELILGATADDDDAQPRRLVRRMRSLGWQVLAEWSGREIVLGAVTRPWEPNVVFRGVPPEEFRVFSEPDYVKIIWNLRADPLGADESLFSTETRARATDGRQEQNSAGIGRSSLQESA
jgi:hypothetical protein